MKEFTASSRVAVQALFALALAVVPCPLVAAAGSETPPPAAAGYQYTVAKLLAQEGSVAEAVAAFAEAERLAPNDPYVHAEYGESLLRLAQNAKGGAEQADLLRRAGDQANRAQQLGPENAETLRTVGGIYLALAGQDNAALGKAQTALEAAYQRDPRDPQTALTLGRLYLDRQQPDKAAEVFQKLVERAPQQRMAVALLVESLLRADKTREAEGALRDLLALDPSSLEARVTLAELLGQRGDQDAAIATLAAAPEALRKEPRLVRQLALSQYLKGEVDASLATLEPLQKASPDDPQVAQLEALIFTALGRNAEAARLLEKLRKGRQDDPALAVTLARVLDRDG
ncbi:MAG TPA: tetratricopeptide repeat protein, partial [Thermoanaerobaculia bacterium]